MALVQGDADRYQLGVCIGRGSYGDVYKGTDTTTGKEIAFKIIDLEDVDDDIESIHKEITMLAGCQCKNITEFYAAVLRPGSTELMIVMELMACSVADLLAHGPLDEESIAHILHEVLQALVYLHGERRIHRDVKAANVLLNEAGQVKISDFGVSGQLTSTMGFSRRTFVGTPFWMAPEVINSESAGGDGYRESADIWSLGITAIEMATGAPPHAELHAMRVLFLIPMSPPPRLEGNFSNTFKDFVAQCLQKDPAGRPSAKALLSHPFIATATSPPPTLGGMAGELAKRRPPLKSRRDMADDWVAMGGTMPAWDFGTRKAGGRGTIRIGDRMGMGTLRGVTAAGPGRPDTDGADGAAATAGTATATDPTTASTDTQGAGTVSKQQIEANGTLPSPTRPVATVNLAAGAVGTSGGGAAGRYASATLQTSSGESSGETYATVRVANQDKYGTVQSKREVGLDGSTSAAGGAGAPSTSTTAAGPSSGGGGGGDGGSEDPESDSLARMASNRRTNALQVEIHDPATASPHLQSQQLADTAAQPQRSFPGHRSQPAAGAAHGAPGGRQSRNGYIGASESSAMLAHVIGPAIDTMTAAAAAATQSAVSQAAQPSGAHTQAQMLAGLKGHLQHAERQYPGTCAQLINELIAHLAATSQPALQPAQAAAAALLGGHAAAAADPGAAGKTVRVDTSAPTLKGSQSDYQAALLSAMSASGGSSGGKPPAPAAAVLAATGALALSSSAGAVLDGGAARQASNGAGGAASAANGAGGPAFLPPRQIPQLGALGEFLLGKWQLEEARSRSLLARAGALS